MLNNRRGFIKNATVLASTGMLLPHSIFSSPGQAGKIRVLVWDERADTEKEGYENFLGNCIADQLKKNPLFTVTSAGLDDAEQGIAEKTLDNTDVILWWGHVRHQEISIEKGKDIAKRIDAGKLSLIALHSAHWSTPFVECMNEITMRRTFADKSVKKEDVQFIRPEIRKSVPLPTERISPYTDFQKFPDGSKKLEVHLPTCVFPGVRNDGKPSTITVLQKTHPIVKGLPATLSLPHTEMYNEPFHVPAPDELIFEECWEGGEWFRSGMVWKLGKGKVFYFRPGHESYPIFKEPWVMQLLTNAITWMGGGKG